MPDLGDPHIESIIAKLEAALLGITVADGYSQNVVRVDRYEMDDAERANDFEDGVAELPATVRLTINGGSSQFGDVTAAGGDWRKNMQVRLEFRGSHEPAEMSADERFSRFLHDVEYALGNMDLTPERTEVSAVLQATPNWNIDDENRTFGFEATLEYTFSVLRRDPQIVTG